ncbi:tRNA pseudouridine synthase A [Linum perenne]
MQVLFKLDDGKFPEVCNGTNCAGALKEDRSGRWERVTFKIVLSYHGCSFDGWQKQPGLNTVQGLIEQCLGGFVDERKAQLLKEKCKPLEGCSFVAGRTDKGVSAIQQVCSFYTWRKDIRIHEIEDVINNTAPGKLRAVSVSEVSRSFHPNFSAKWRRYLYIFPLNDGENKEPGFLNEGERKDLSIYGQYGEQTDGSDELTVQEGDKNLTVSCEVEPKGPEKPKTFTVCKVNRLLQKLEGKYLSYTVFARDTKASRSIGPPTECLVYHARATEARLPHPDLGAGRRVMCVELVGNRFLRKMVRVLVATSIREAAAGAEDDALLKLVDATCRRATAPPAPPQGLCFVNVGCNDFDPQHCIIP